MTLALMPVAMIEMASTISVAPVPGAGFSTMCSGVGPEIIGRTKGNSRSASVGALASPTGELAEQVVEQQRSRGRDLLRRRTSGTGGRVKACAGS